MAWPHVAGLVALMAQEDPSLTPAGAVGGADGATLTGSGKARGQRKH